MPTEVQEPSLTEQMGDIEDEKTFHNEKLGGSFTFRLPFVMDEVAVLRRRVQIMGIPEEMAGQEIITVSHARAMFEVYNVHAPHGFNIDKLRTWAPFLELMSEVGNWHNEFFRSVG